VNSVLNLRIPRNAGKLSSGLTSSGLSSSAQLHIVSYYLSALDVYVDHMAIILRRIYTQKG
jgi:hypothetical protein